MSKNVQYDRDGIRTQTEHHPGTLDWKPVKNNREENLTSTWFRKNVKMSHFLNGVEWGEVQNLCQGGKFWTLHWTYSGNDIMINGSDKIHSLSQVDLR